jgi:predicted ribosome quality control (RQC) complex YloA/Tae2 family protein
MLELVDAPGPLVLIDGKLSEERIEMAARIAARYSKNQEGKVPVEYRENSADDATAARVLEVEPYTPAETDQLVIK